MMVGGITEQKLLLDDDDDDGNDDHDHDEDKCVNRMARVTLVSGQGPHRSHLT